MMRITSNMLVQQLVQAAKSEGVQKPSQGTAITAKIAESLNGLLMLDLGGGNLVAAKDLSGRAFAQGQTVVFDVIGQDESGNLQIRPAAMEGETTDSSETLGQILKKMNMPDTSANKELLKVLSSYRIPLNAENVKTAQEIARQAKGLVQLAETSGADILTGHESEPIKQLATRLAAVAVTQGKSAEPEASTGVKAQASPETPIEVTQQKQTDKAVAEKGPPGDGNKPFDMQKTGKMATESKMNTESMKPQVELFEPAEPIKTAVTEKPVKALPDKAQNESLRAEGLRETLKQLTFEKIGFVIKNQLPGDMETLGSLDKLIMGRKDLGIQLRELLANLQGDEMAAPLRDAIQNAVKAVHVSQEMNPFELQKQLKDLNLALASVSTQASEMTLGSQRVQEALAEVKSSLDFLGRLSESATYLHVPVNLGQGTKPMDLYVQRDRSGQKKVNPRDTRIFISLDTNTMKTVQCLVQVQDKRLNVGFKMADEEALGKIKAYFKPLEESLANMGYSDVMIHAVVYQKQLNLMDITQEPPLDSRQIDVRI